MQLQIPKPCSENWNEMTVNERGRFCATCQKTIVDFQNMTLPEIKNYIQQQSTAVCGRFPSSKLDEFNSTYQDFPSPLNIQKWTIAAILAGSISLPILGQQTLNTSAISSSIVSSNLNINYVESTMNSIAPPTGDSIILAGKVIDSYGETLPFANVYIEGSSIGITSDLNGLFQLKVPKTPNKIVLKANYIGYSRLSMDIIPDRSKKDLLLTLYEEAELLGIIVPSFTPKELKAQKRQAKRKNKHKA